jgi:hypothetical protein
MRPLYTLAGLILADRVVVECGNGLRRRVVYGLPEALPPP